MEPTVLTDVPMDVPMFKEETFGPVAPLVRFTSVDDAIRMANDSPYGLQSAVFTQDINQAFDIAYRLEAGGRHRQLVVRPARGDAAVRRRQDERTRARGRA